jgi:hypothetical protein
LFSFVSALDANTDRSVSAWCLSSASTRADAYASAKLKEDLLRLVRCWLGEPQPLESGNQAFPVTLHLLLRLGPV